MAAACGMFLFGARRAIRFRPDSDVAVGSFPKTKLNPPRSTSRMIARDALLARLTEARRQRCIVLHGPAGSGKSSTLLAFRRSLLSLDFDVAWLSLAAEDDDPIRFFDLLLASIAVVDPEAVRETSLLIGGDCDESAIERWVLSLVRGITPRSRDLTLVIDDLHLVRDPRIHEALRWLLEYAPESFHLAIGSRDALPVQLGGRLRARGWLSEFGMNDLRFSFAESESFLRGQLGSINDREVHILHDLADGWIAGLQLLAVDYKRRQGAPGKRVPVRDAGAFREYIEHEVLVRLTPDSLDLLTRASICSRFSASLCASLLQRPHLASQMAIRLADLEDENLFVSVVGNDGRETWYRIHPLLRGVLLARVAALPESERQALHAIAWRWFHALGHVEEAVRHAVEAGEAAAAAELVEERSLELLTAGEIRTLAGLMRRLPAEQVQRRAGLRLAKAHLQQFTRDLEGCADSIREIESMADALEERRRHELVLLRAGILMQRDDIDGLAAMLPELQGIPDDAGDFCVGSRDNVLAFLYTLRGEYELARRAVEQGGRRYRAPRSTLAGRWVEGVGYAIEGNLAKAEALLREVLRDAERQGASCVGLVTTAAGMLADVLFGLNEVDSAISLLEGRIDLLDRLAMPDTVQRAHAVLARAYWSSGRWAEAHASLDQLEAYAGRCRLDRPLAYLLAMRVGMHLQRGEVDLAEAALAKARALRAKHAAEDTRTARAVRQSADLADVDMYLHRGDFDAAAARLGTMIAQYRAERRGRAAVAMQMRLAAAEFGRGQEKAAREQLLAALEAGRRFGAIRGVVDTSPRMPSVIDALLKGVDLDPVLAFYVQRLLSANAQAPGRTGEEARPRASLGGLSEREMEVLRLLGDALPNKKIARTLGVSPDTVKFHLKNIYGKLGVSGRDEAVARYRDLTT